MEAAGGRGLGPVVAEQPSRRSRLPRGGPSAGRASAGRNEASGWPWPEIVARVPGRGRWHRRRPGDLLGYTVRLRGGCGREAYPPGAFLFRAEQSEHISPRPGAPRRPEARGKAAAIAERAPDRRDIHGNVAGPLAGQRCRSTESRLRGCWPRARCPGNQTRARQGGRMCIDRGATLTSEGMDEDRDGRGFLGPGGATTEAAMTRAGLESRPAVTARRAWRWTSRDTAGPHPRLT